MKRRDFLAAAGAASAWTGVGPQQPATPAATGDRETWIALMRRLADPVLTNLARGTLKSRMRVEQAAGANRRSVTHLEALGRLAAGIAPWLELPADDTAEGRMRADYRRLARRAIAHAVDPASPDSLNFTRDRQPLVDAAFLAQGLLRAPRALRDGLDAEVKRRLAAALESTRAITPGFNNWLLFSAMVEAGLKALGASWDRARVDYAVREHEQWYKGDGAYGDGPDFHWDYYNSFVIHPMLVDLLEACGAESPAWMEIAVRVEQRARRYAAVQERLISPDGSFPPIGRSIAYRCGAFHLLAQSALRRRLPGGVSPAQVRGALTAAIRRTLDSPGTFDSDGWLQIGLCGHQPAPASLTSRPAACISVRSRCSRSDFRPLTSSGRRPRSRGRQSAPGAANRSRSTTRSKGARHSVRANGSDKATAHPSEMQPPRHRDTETPSPNASPAAKRRQRS